MSFVTSVILIFSGVEDEEERIREVNSFSYRNIPLDIRSIESPNKEEFTAWYGGTKSINGHVYVGSYNYFEINKFLHHISQVNWEKSEYVQILIRSENEWNYNLFGNAGKEQIYKAIIQ
jgi:hypothetical protein